MPEAAVYKYGDFSLWKHKIRMALYRVIPPPACNSVLLKNFNQPKFGTLIFIRLDLPHNVRSLFCVEYIRHNRSPCFKLYAEAGIGFRFQYDLVISGNYVGER